MSKRPLGWTTLEESERLAKAGLDSNTADMTYRKWKTKNGKHQWEAECTQYAKYLEEDGDGGKFPEYLIKPCWSLGKLFDLLPETINGEGFQFGKHLESYDDSEFEIEYYSSQCRRTLEWWHGEVMIEVVVNALVWLSEHGHIEKTVTKQ